MATEQDNQEDIQNDEIIGVALRWSMLAGVLIALVVAIGFAINYFADQGEPEVVETEIELPKQRAVEQESTPVITLTDVTKEAGIDWQHVSGMEGEKLLPETMGGGVAIADYDQDGDMDLLFVGGNSWPWAKQTVAQPRSLCLYQNDGQGKFADVTKQAGLPDNLYGMGALFGDIDNDGWTDLFVSAVGQNLLFRNKEGVFEDYTQQAGMRSERSGWSTGSTWIDYDRDGLLDLFVCDYVVWNRELDLSLGFSLTGVGRAYGQPTLFTGTHSTLWHNEGNGKFVDVTEEMGIPIENPDTGVPVGKGLGVGAIDVNQDGWPDVVVANDTVQNFLFVNNQGEGFEELAIPMGIAYDRSGNATGAMGVDCGFLRNDDSFAIAIGNFANEQSSLYLAREPDVPFTDVAMSTGLGPMSRLNLTFGMVFGDLDLDGRQDIVCANGHLEAEISKVQSTQQYEQPPQYFWNAGKKGSSEFVSLQEEHVGADALKRMVGRGTAVGDLDGDGDLDVVLVSNSGSPRLLRNDQQLGNHWLRVKLIGEKANGLDAYGALVTLKNGDAVQRRYVMSARSYLSQCESVLTFGLGQSDAVSELRVDWPSGQSELFDVSIDEMHELQEGTGTPAKD